MVNTKKEMVIGNIKEPTKWFSTNTKVYVLYITGDPSRCLVLGKARGSKGGMQKIWIPSKYITNHRISEVYKINIIKQFLGYHGRDLIQAIDCLKEAK